MPPETLKARFLIRFFPPMKPAGDVRGWLATPSVAGDPKSYVWLELMPRRQQDAQNWSKAQVMLSKPDYLPAAVKLIGPAAGGREPDVETVYNFKDLKPNRPAIAVVFRRNPFEPNLSGYTVVRGNGAGGPPVAGRPGAAPETKYIVPAVVGMPFDMAAKVLKGRGYAAKKYDGPPTDRATLVGKVAKQQYEKGREVPRGTEVGVQVWTAAPGVRAAGATKEAAAGR